MSIKDLLLELAFYRPISAKQSAEEISKILQKNYERSDASMYLHKLSKQGFLIKNKIPSKHYSAGRTTDFYYISRKGLKYLIEKRR